MRERDKADTKRTKFISTRFCHLVPLMLFTRSLARSFIALFVPIRPSFGGLRYSRYVFGYYALSLLFFTVFFVVDYVLYLKASKKTWRIYEWCGVTVGLILTIIIAWRISDFPRFADFNVKTTEYTQWVACLEEDGLAVNAIQDTASFLEPQSWETTSYWKNGGRSTVMYLYYSDCRTERFAQNDRLQFYADQKDSEIRQYTRDGIISITAKREDSSSEYVISELLIYKKTVMLLTIEGAEQDVNALFEMFSPKLSSLLGEGTQSANKKSMEHRGRFSVLTRKVPISADFPA